MQGTEPIQIPNFLYTRPEVSAGAELIGHMPTKPNKICPFKCLSAIFLVSLPGGAIVLLPKIQ